MTPRSTAECKVCGKDFEKLRPLQRVCGLSCAKKHSAQIKKELKEKVKADRAEVVKRRERLKTRSDWLRETQVEFNRFIRARDYGKACISCARNSGSKVNAGHFLSVGARPDLRFNEDNCHLQCEYCNSYLSGNIAMYRPALIALIGIKRVERLQGKPAVCKWTEEEIKALKARYKALTKDLLASREQ